MFSVIIMIITGVGIAACIVALYLRIEEERKQELNISILASLISTIIMCVGLFICIKFFLWWTK